MVVFHGTSTEAARPIGGQLDAGQYVTDRPGVARGYARFTVQRMNAVYGRDPYETPKGAVLKLEVDEAALELDDDPRDRASYGHAFRLLSPARIIGVEYVAAPATPARDRRGLFSMGR